MIDSTLFNKRSILSIVGAGGKTSLMFYLARHLPWNCLATTTTKVGSGQIQTADRVGTFESFMGDPALFAGVKVAWVSPPPDAQTGKISGFTPLEFRWFAAVARSLPMPIINEADGAHCRHIKAPSDFEPVIPEETTHVLHLTGLDVLDQPIDERTVHRVEIFTEITGTKHGQLLDDAILVRNILHPGGGFKNTPPGAKRIAVLNQADTPERIKRGLNIAESLIDKGIDSVWITSLKTEEGGKVPGVVHHLNSQSKEE